MNQTPSPNTGTLINVGPLGSDISSGQGLNLDIALDGTALATAVVGGVQNVYTVNLTSGQLTATGPMQPAIGSFAVLPATSAQFSATGYTQAESGSAVVTVNRTGSLATTATVAYATGGGSATGADYDPVSGSLSFGPDETSKTFTVPVFDDTGDEPDETVGLTLASSDPAVSLGDPAMATLTIADNDAPADTAGPTTRLAGVARSITYERFLRGLRLRLTPNEPAAFEVALLGTVRRATASAFNLTLASRTLRLAGGARSVRLRPSRRLVGRPRGAFRVRLRIVATDSARNRRTLTRTIRVKRPVRSRRR